jgi:hypothetical protein
MERERRGGGGDAAVAGMLLGEGYSNVELWIEPVARVIKVGLVLAVLAAGVWLGLRIWKKRQDSH